MVSIGTIVWLSSELMFFAALFAMYFTLRAVNPELWKEDTALLNVPFASVNTTILVLSSVTCQLGVFAAERGDVKGLRRWFIITFLMGAIFIGGQITEYVELIHQGVTLSSNADRVPRTPRDRRPHRLPLCPCNHVRFEEIHARPSDASDRCLVLLALRRCGVDRTVFHDLHSQVGTAHGVN
jgi:hypothetical protein